MSRSRRARRYLLREVNGVVNHDAQGHGGDHGQRQVYLPDKHSPYAKRHHRRNDIGKEADEADLDAAKASSSTPEMRMRARTVPESMLRMLRLEICESMMAPLAAWENIAPGAFPRSHASARPARSRISRAETLPRVAVRRVADRSTLIWLFRSSP